MEWQFWESMQDRLSGDIEEGGRKMEGRMEGNKGEVRGRMEGDREEGGKG